MMRLDNAEPLVAAAPLRVSKLRVNVEPDGGNTERVLEWALDPKNCVCFSFSVNDRTIVEGPLSFLRSMKLDLKFKLFLKEGDVIKSSFFVARRGVHPYDPNKVLSLWVSS